ncbi:GNAT family N-acetyltransferase [Staphylococcus casei]|uniref:GNAT family N-acetyltransferase n=1 Tax=Staphylococcus TaxID=1279 RepID=UPI000CD09390|nr:GNAT family N-acetyltransferase [Staphylococcus casei]PNZ58537.1 GNAT family N-acetyltransferase [Staphylococcus casei]WJE87551.1 GNAT family N-acetyltransferase [Staphylococcus casei]
MEIKVATSMDVTLINHIMKSAFAEYKTSELPSSALQESEEMILNAFKQGEKAHIVYDKQEPVAMVRFKQIDNNIHFSRLSVIPHRQGEGISKMLLVSLELHAKKYGMTNIVCKVRTNVPRNINIYQSMGYKQCEEQVIYKEYGQPLKVVTMLKAL